MDGVDDVLTTEPIPAVLQAGDERLTRCTALARTAPVTGVAPRSLR
jgi:hypothetical protein